jgi:hypothetical protein
VAQGLTNQQIAEEMVRSLSTIKSHVTRIQGRLEAVDRTHAVTRGYDLGYLKPKTCVCGDRATAPEACCSRFAFSQVVATLLPSHTVECYLRHAEKRI